MQGARRSRSAVLQWVVVLVVGILVVTVVLGLHLMTRLNDGQKVLDAARPAFAPERVAGSRTGIDMISANVDAADPIMTDQGTAASEVPKLVAFVSQKTGLSQAQVLAALKKNFPHTTALLQAIPLSEVTAEIPKLVAFLSATLKLPPADVLAALKQNFPGLAQSVTNLPTVTSGWNHVQKIDGLTRFDGKPVVSVPDVRTYFSADLIPVLENQQGNFQTLDGKSKLDWIAPLLLVVGIIVILFAGLMIVLNLRGPVSRGVAMGAAGVVIVVGVGMAALVLGLSLVSRTNDGQKLLDALGPVNAPNRIAGDRAGITMVSAIVDTEDPIMTDQGTAASEVPKLVAFVSQKTGLSQAQVLAALKKNFPHTTALLQAIPLSEVTAEIPKLVAFLSATLKLPPADVLAALKQNFPGLAQSVTSLPTVTNGWNQVPKIGGLTRFNGKPVQSVPDVRTYFSSDVIPVLENEHADYVSLTSTSKIDFIGPLVLIVGLIVILYGALMLYLASRLPRTARAPAATPVPAT